MKTSIEARLTLEEVTKHFAQWRQSRKKGQRIPEHLWGEALSLVDSHGVSGVSRMLRLTYTELKKRRRRIAEANEPGGTEGNAAFVEVERALLYPPTQTQSANTGWVELERPDGLRLRIHSAGSADMLALADRFMGI